jgi:ornithine cyclodeaminase/alanine dehydrogenase
MTECMAAVEEGFRQLAMGAVLLPQRTAIRMTDLHGLHLGMPAYVGGAGGGVLGLKVVTVYPDNPSRYELPTTIGTLLLNDPKTGALLAIMDAGYLTAMRTGAASGVATKHLARPGASTVGIFGAGVMARTQLLAVHEARPLQRALVFDPAGEAAERFAADMRERLSIPVEVATGARECAACDIVCAATSSRTPIVEADWIRPGTHVNGVGAHAPDTREFDLETIRRVKFVADHVPACLAEAGEIMIPIHEGGYSEQDIHGSIGEVIRGTKPGRTSDEEITFFKSVGLAVQDVMTAQRVYELAGRAGIGTDVRI